MPFRKFLQTGLVTVAAAILTACSGGTDSSGGHARSCAAVQGPGVPGSGSAATHGSAQREDGEVTVTHEGGRYRARRTVTLSNDFGGASSADVSLSGVNGPIDTCVLEGGGYRFKVRLEGSGATEADARQALDSMTVTHGDALAGGTLQLATRVELQPLLPLLDPAVQRRADIVAGLPSRASYGFVHSTTNGDIQAHGFSGRRARFSTSNGSLTLDGRWDQTDLSATNGLVVVSGDHADLDASTTNGGIRAALVTARSSTVDLSNTNGGIDVVLQRRNDPGFDLTATTTNGRAVIRVAGTEAVGEQSSNHAHRVTPGYASKPQQVQVRATSTNGDVLIRD